MQCFLIYGKSNGSSADLLINAKAEMLKFIVLLASVAASNAYLLTPKRRQNLRILHGHARTGFQAL